MELINSFHAAPEPQPGSENAPYLRLLDPSRDFVQLQFITGNASTYMAMCVV